MKTAGLFPCALSGLPGSLKACGRAGVAAALCMLLVEQPLLAEGATQKVPAAAPAAEIQGRDRVLHALDRLTFGPRPGDVAAVQAIGLNRWFEMQLNPASIDDARLDQRLAQYPAMQLSVEELERKYPSPLLLRGIMAGRVPMPDDPAERALVTEQIEFYKIQKAKQEAAAPAAAGQPQNGAMATEQGAPNAAGKRQKQRQIQAGMAALNDGAMAENGQGGMEKPLPASEISAVTIGEDGASGDSASSRADIQRILSLPPEQRMQSILAMPAPGLVRFRQSLRPTELAQLTAGMTPQQKETLVALPGSLRMVALESMESRLDRDLYSDRQLEAVMTDFWLNHFNVYVRKNQQEPYLIPSYERESIRPHALGNFEDLLVATAKSPAMLVYLDNFRSTGPDSPAAGRIKQLQAARPNGKLIQQASAGLNENYGRELMELHTLGVSGGYTQADVTQVAKVFTGWTIDKPYQGGSFKFDERRHEPGSKTVLGKTIHEAGEQEGLEVLHMLATSPATAHFISEKLAVRFVSDDPPTALVDRMAASFLSSHGDIKTVLRTMWGSPEFWAPAVYRAKVKTPLEFVVSAVRASGVEVTNPQALVQSLDKLGMPLYGMQTPNGYSWKQDDWVGTGALVSRLNFSLVLSAGRLPGTRTEWPQLLGDAPAGVVPASYAGAATTDPAAVKEKKLEGILLGQPVSERTRATVLGQSGDASVTDQAETQFDLGAGGGGGKKSYLPRGSRGQVDRPGGNAPEDAQAAVMAGLLLGSPEFQRR